MLVPHQQTDNLGRSRSRLNHRDAPCYPAVPTTCLILRSSNPSPGGAFLVRLSSNYSSALYFISHGGYWMSDERKGETIFFNMKIINSYQSLHVLFEHRSPQTLTDLTTLWGVQGVCTLTSVVLNFPLTISSHPSFQPRASEMKARLSLIPAFLVIYSITFVWNVSQRCRRSKPTRAFSS